MTLTVGDATGYNRSTMITSLQGRTHRMSATATLPSEGMPGRGLSIAIDGPAGAGKSTVARHTACALEYLYIDTGAMYRALAWYVGDTGISPESADAVVAAANSLDVRLRPADADEPGTRVFVGNREITDEIRTPAISNLTSALSVIGGVRSRMVELQKQMGACGGVVMEGRDIGTVVLPNAEVKVFLTASPERRALRRQAELRERGIDTPYATLLAEMIERDARDSSRDIAPMVPASDAHVLDSDPLTADEVVDHIVAWHREAFVRRGG